MLSVGALSSCVHLECNCAAGPWMLEQARLLAGQHRPPQRTCSCRAERNASIRPGAPTSRSLWSEPLAAATRASQTPVAQESRNLNLAGAAPAPSDDAFRSLVDIVWDGSEADALLATSPLSREHPLWRLLLLSDGSVTRHLQILTGSAVTVDCLSMEPVSTGDSGLPRAVAELEHPLLQREVRRPDSAPAELAVVHSKYSSAVRGTRCYTACPQMG